MAFPALATVAGNRGRRLRRSTDQHTVEQREAWTQPAAFSGGHRDESSATAATLGACWPRELAAYRGTDGVLVLGLARGGVPVAWEVAAALSAQLDVFLVRKLGVPQWSELAMGALASGGGRGHERQRAGASLNISDEQVRAVIDRESGRFRAARARLPGRPAAA